MPSGIFVFISCNFTTFFIKFCCNFTTEVIHCIHRNLIKYKEIFYGHYYHHAPAGSHGRILRYC